jgi:hypothetical protein
MKLTFYITLAFIGSTFLLYAAFLTAPYFLVKAWLFLMPFWTQKAIGLPLFEYSIEGGLFSLIFLIIIILNNSFGMNVSQIKCSQGYLKLFKKPEHAVNFWLNLNFLISLFSGTFFVLFSLKNLCNMCSIDVSTFNIDYDVFIGALDRELTFILAEKSFILACLLFLCYLFAWLAKKTKRVNETCAYTVQALFLILVSGGGLLLSTFKLLELSMIGFVEALLLASIVASIVSLLSAYGFLAFLKPTKKAENYLVNYFFSLIEISQKQYLLSYTAFLAYSNFLNWCLLFNASAASTLDNVNTTCLINITFFSWFLKLFVAFFWLYLAFSFLKSAVNFQNKKKHNFTVIPFVPVLIWSIYLIPLFGIFKDTWVSIAANTGENTISFFKALLNPTQFLAKNLVCCVSDQGVVAFIASPSENSSLGFLEFAIKAGQMVVAGFYVFAEQFKYAARVEQIDADLNKYEGYNRVLRDLAKVTKDPEMLKLLPEAFKITAELQNPRLTIEEKDALLKAGERLINIMIQTNLCIEQLGSPRSGIVRPCSTGQCLDLELRASLRADMTNESIRRELAARASTSSSLAADAGTSSSSLAPEAGTSSSSLANAGLDISSQALNALKDIAQ